MSTEAVAKAPTGTWVIVTQVKSYRVVYFTDDADYQPPMGGDWYYVSPYQGELPRGMTLRNCWRWRFNGMAFVDAGKARAPDAQATLLRNNRQALLDMLSQRIDALRRPNEPSSVGGAELRAAKLADARAFIASPLATPTPLLCETAAAHRCAVEDMARRIVELHDQRMQLLVRTEAMRESLACAIRRATTQAELLPLRERIVEDVAAGLTELAATKPPHTTPPKAVEALDPARLGAERYRLRLQLRDRINELRRPYVSQYVLDDQVLDFKAEIASAVQQAGGALPPGTDGTPLISHAAARGQRLAEAAEDVLNERREIRAALLATEQMKDAFLARIAAVGSSDDMRAIERAISRLDITPVPNKPAPPTK